MVVALSRLAARISSSRQTRLFESFKNFAGHFVTLLDDTPTNISRAQLSFRRDVIPSCFRSNPASSLNQKLSIFPSTAISPWFGEFFIWTTGDELEGMNFSNVVSEFVNFRIAMEMERQIIMFRPGETCLSCLAHKVSEWNKDSFSFVKLGTNYSGSWETRF